MRSPINRNIGECACGHGSHVAAAIGAARILWELRDQINGSVKFIFQPAEEAPGGAETNDCGWSLEKPRSRRDYWRSRMGKAESGIIEVMSGPTMASSDAIRLKLSGKGACCSTAHDD